MAKDDTPPTSRMRRTATVGRLAATGAVRLGSTRAANLVRSDEKGAKAMEKQTYLLADQLVTMLGTMKGAAMKVGQMLSVLEVGLVPEEYREEFQAKLAALQASAKPVPFKDMKKVIEKDLGEKLADVFSEFDEDPIGAASIGQVYRARLHDGREVAVKVQYPGIDTAVRVDLQNLAAIMRLIKMMAPGLDIQALTEEIRERIVEELDYELEAANQRTAARIFRGHPFIVVPGVVGEYSRDHVLVTEFVPGMKFDAIKELDQETRDRVGEIVFRFYVGTLYRHGQYSPDPHPGNFLLLDDGRVAFLDFGLYKHLDSETVESEKEAQRLVAAGDRVGLHAHLASNGFIPDPERLTPDDAFDYVYEAFWWYCTDEDIAMTPELSAETIAQTVDPRSDHFGKARHQQMPAEHVLIRRMEIMVMAALGHLGATANWYRISTEWIDGAEPTTDLGRLEADAALAA